MKKDIREMPEFTHKGILAGFVPVYCNTDGTMMAARWWWAEYLLDFVDFMVVHCNANPQLIFTGEI